MIKHGTKQIPLGSNDGMSGLQYCYIASILVVGNHFHTGWLNIQYVPIIAFNRNGISTVHTIIQSFFFSVT